MLLKKDTEETVEYNVKPLIDGCKNFGITLSDEQVEQLIIYYENLIEKNKVMNLTGITDFQDVLIKHFLDSLSIVKAMDMKNVNKILDIGTGAGFPGIPLKIVFPEKEFVLLDSLNKRIKFIQEIIDKCRLKKIIAVHGRAEEIVKKKEYREAFDLCVSRAVANLSSLSEYCLPYVRIGAYFVSYKSAIIDMELENSKNAIKILGGEIRNKVSFILPNSDIERCLILIEKMKATPAKYPRKAGLPSKEPLQ